MLQRHAELLAGPGFRKPSKKEMRKMQSVRSSRYLGDSGEYDHQAQGETIWDRIGNFATTEPVMGRPSLDPAGDMVSVSYMAGYSDDAPVGHDAMQGVSAMVTPGGPDANKELNVDSATEGGPLELSTNETMFQDDHRAGTHSLDGEEEDYDWCAELSCEEDL